MTTRTKTGRPGGFAALEDNLNSWLKTSPKETDTMSKLDKELLATVEEMKRAAEIARDLFDCAPNFQTTTKVYEIVFCLTADLDEPPAKPGKLTVNQQQAVEDLTASREAARQIPGVSAMNLAEATFYIFDQRFADDYIDEDDLEE